MSKNQPVVGLDPEQQFVMFEVFQITKLSSRKTQTAFVEFFSSPPNVTASVKNFHAIGRISLRK